MEPWPFSHGYDSDMDFENVPVEPSMEPWPFSHGYLSGDSSCEWAAWFLQWSHGPLAMDTIQKAELDKAEPDPSMEPWPFSHGYK